MKKIIMMSIIGLFIIGIMTGCGCSKSDTEKNQTKFNNNENVIRDQQIEVFQFTNTSLTYEEGTSVLETTVTNTSDEVAFLSEFKIHVRDEFENEMIELVGFVGEELKAKESRVITSYSLLDLSNAYSISYEVIR